MFPSYAELHCLTNFTFLRGASHSEELVERASKLGYSALAITDECSLAGVVRAHVAAKEAGLKLIIGTELTISISRLEARGERREGKDESRGDESPITNHESRTSSDEPRTTYHVPRHQSRITNHESRTSVRLVLLATDRNGYGNLAELISRGRRRAAKGKYELTCGDLEQGLPGCLALLLPESIPDLEYALWLKSRFEGRCWIAAELFLGPDDRARLAALETFSLEADIPLVAAGDVHMHVRARRALQDTLTAIRLKSSVAESGHALFPNGERYLRSRERLGRLYPPELLIETLNVAERCCFSLDSLRYEYPEELVPPGETPASHLRKLTEDGFRWRFAHELRPQEEQVERAIPPETRLGWGNHFTSGHRVDVNMARKRVEHELALIAELRYEPYFLTVHNVVKFARSQGILCQGRGSAANSAVCYCLGITEVDPGRMDMLFERFLSRERNEPPDIDVDFEHERREEVIQYIYRKYGRDRAALAATVITYRPKSALRDVGKALGLDLAQVDRLAKGMAWWDGGKVRAERLREAGFDPDNPVIQRLIALVNILVGFPRHLSQHVGGFVISRGPLSQLVPVENAAMVDRTIIQWDKDDLDALGLLKIDVLALGMLTAIRRALDLVSQIRGKPFSMMDIPPEDPGVYEMVGHADTIGVFQIESRAQQAMLPRMQPRNFYDLVIEVAIVRPGPIQGGMVHPYLRRRQGIEPVSYPSEKVKEVLERTLGVPIFQEQVMQLAVVAAGFTPGEADKLRRAMAAWRRKGGLEPFEKRLKEGMSERGYAESFADQIYRQILGFGEYGFPESHSVSFALLVYVSCWLKCYEPAAFTCALLNSQPMGFYAPSQLLQDAQRHGVEVRPVDVLISDWDCTLESHALGERQEARGSPSPYPSPAREAGNTSPQPAIRLGLSVVKGLSKVAAERLVAVRANLWSTATNHESQVTTHGFQVTSHVSRTTNHESRLSNHGSFEILAHAANLTRHDMNALAAAGTLAPIAGHRRQAAWIVTGVEARPPVLQGTPILENLPILAAPTEGEDLVTDYASLGLTLGRHPLALLRPQLEKLHMSTASDLKQISHGKLARAAGLVIGRQRPDTASGVIFVTLEDETGMINVVVWRDVADRQRRALLGSQLLAVHGVVERQGEVIHLIAGKLVDHSALLGRLTVHSRDFH